MNQEFIAAELPPLLRHSQARIGLVLGSGLGSLVEGLEDLQELPYSALPGLPSSRVEGHAGKFATGRLAGTELLLACGRIHLYEGHGARDVSALVRVMQAAGCDRVILTNAAGTLRLHQPPGQWMLIDDQINLTGCSPLEGAPHFVDMSEIYCKAWRRDFLQCAEQLGIEMGRGIYAGLRGPQYETPAEIQMLKSFGADAVGMSTVLEAIQARALGMRVAGFSCLTNWAAGLSDGPLDHEEVMASGRAQADSLIRILSKYLSLNS